MKKILILANIDLGLYKFRRELVEKLVEENEVYICIPDGPFVEKLQKIGAKFVSCNLMDRRGTNPLKEIKLYRYYIDTLKKIKPDIVLSYTIKPNVYGGLACQKLRIPYVANVTGLGTAVENPGLLQLITISLYKLGLKKAQKVFFQNEANKQFMLDKHVVKGAYDILPGSGVNLKQYNLLDYPESKEMHFLFIARVMREKGIEQYLEAAEKLTAKYDNLHFHVCGFCEEEYEKRLQQLQQSGIIEYHGMVEDMLPFYELAACTVHPTFYPEGLSNVLLESSACGRPIITTNRSGCKEVIEDGINGFLVNERDSKDLIDKIEKFIAMTYEERKKMGINGRKKVEREFDRQIVVDKYLKEVTNC